MRMGFIAVMSAKIKTTVCLALYIQKLKYVVCISFLQEIKTSKDGVQLTKHINLKPM